MLFSLIYEKVTKNYKSYAPNDSYLEFMNLLEKVPFHLQNDNTRIFIYLIERRIL